MENINEKLNHAVDLINKEEYTAAVSILRQLSKVDTQNIEIYKNLGLCEINLDNPIEAKEAFNKALEINPEDACSIFYLANCYCSTGEKDIAIENFKKVIQLRPEYTEAYKSLAMIYIEFSQINKAIELIEEALNNPNIEADYSLYHLIATAYMIEKKYTKASVYLDKALELANENITILNAQAVCYMNLEENEKVLPLLFKAYEINNKDSLTVYNIGVFYQKMGDFKNALKYFQISYELESSITMLVNLADCALQAQEYAIASVLFQNLVMVYPNNSKYRLSLIETYEMTAQYKEALEQVNTLLTLDTKNITLIKKKGALLRKLKLYEESTEIFDTLIKRGKIDIEVYYNLAFNYVELEDYDKASEMFKKCITLEPNNPFAHKDLGVLYLKMNCYEWAVDEMKQAIELEEDVAEFHYSLGVSYMMLSDLENAKKALQRAYELDSNDADILAYIGYIHLLEKDYELALAYLQNAIKIAPDNFLAKNHISKYYFEQEKYEISKQFLLDLITQSNDDEILNMLAICNLKLKEYKEAMGILFNLSTKYPKNHIILTNLAKCEIKCDKKEEAREHLRQALMIYDDYSEALELLEEIK